MKKLVIISAVLLAASIALGAKARTKVRARAKVVAPKKVATTAPAPAPSTTALIAEANKYELAGQYAQAAKSARSALAVSGTKDIKHIPSIRKQLRRLARRLSSSRRLAVMTSALAKRPDDLVTRERIIRLCVMELDDPARANGFMNEDVDQILQTYVPMAATAIDKVAEAQSRVLAEWYLSCLKTPSPFGRVVMLRRAAAYYDRFLQLHTAVDDEQRAAILQRDRVVGSLAELGEIFESQKTPS